MLITVEREQKKRDLAAKPPLQVDHSKESLAPVLLTQIAAISQSPFPCFHYLA